MTSFIKKILKTRQTKSVEHKQNTKVSCLKQGSEMNGFCLKQGQGWKALAAYPTQTPPPPGLFPFERLVGNVGEKKSSGSGCRSRNLSITSDTTHPTLSEVVYGQTA